MAISNEIIVEAIYQDGLLKPLEPINLPDNVRVKIQITSESQPRGGG
jgi:predicted DNA-binding antitoxin AbrB/MazE fold protein